MPREKKNFATLKESDLSSLASSAMQGGERPSSANPGPTPRKGLSLRTMNEMMSDMSDLSEEDFSKKYGRKRSDMLKWSY